MLDSKGVGLYIPPGIWAEQIYKTKDSALMVLCDRPYEPVDYIHDFDEYLIYKQQALRLVKLNQKDVL